MELDDHLTSCPHWFPLFLVGIGGISLAVCQVLT